MTAAAADGVIISAIPMNSVESESFHHPPTPESSGDFQSSLRGRQGRGERREKRASVAETFDRIREIMSILPEPAKEEIGRDIAGIRQSPEAAVELIRSKIEAYRGIIDMLDNSISTDRALAELQKLVPPKPEKVH